MQLLALLLITWFAYSTLLFQSPEPAINTGNNRVALSLPGDGSFAPSNEQLNRARDMGITLLEISDFSGMNEQWLDEFFFLLRSPLKFTTPHRLADTEAILTEIENHYSALSLQQQNRIAALSLFEYPDDRSEQFFRRVEMVADSIRNQIDRPLYYKSAFQTIPAYASGFSFISLRLSPSAAVGQISSPVVEFGPSHQASESLESLQSILNRLLDFNESIVIIPAGWFFKRLEKQPQLSILFADHIRGETIQFPIPAYDPGIPNPNLPVIFLAILLACFVVLYKYQPMYPSIILRYFFNHTFLVADIMENRLRNITPGLILLGLHSVMTGVLLFVLADYFISETGMQAIIQAVPSIFTFPVNPAFIFMLIGILAGLLLHIISILWIFFLNKSINYPNQIVNLYCWPLFLNVFTLSALVYLTQINAGTFLTLTAAFLFVMIWFITFNIAAVDGARYLPKLQILNIFLTVGVHFILITAAVLFVFFSPEIFEPFYLALKLP